VSSQNEEKKKRKSERERKEKYSASVLPFVVLLLLMMMNKVFLRIVTNYGRNFSSLPAAAKKPSSDNRSAQLKQMLLSPQLEFIMEAHSALSAKIVEETGFKVSSKYKTI
jgi:H+/gluconate symporter-like permease